MNSIDRRSFLKTTGAALAASTLTGTSQARPAASMPWRKAFMLGVESGPILPHFKRLKNAGFEGVELLSPNKLDRDEVLKARDETGLVIHGVSGTKHWSHPLSSPDPKVVKENQDAIRKEIEDVKAYGGTTVLVVPGIVTSAISYRQVYERSQAAIKEIIPDCEKHGIKIGIEEVWNKFLLSSVELARYVDDFKSPWIGAYFDVGNIVEYGYPQEWIRELERGKKRILKVHIKEYKKARRFDYKLGEGEIDWPAVRQALTDVGYDGWITAEVGYGDDAELKDIVRRMDKILGA